MINLSMPAERQGEAACFLSPSPRAAALFLLSSVEPLVDQAPPPASPASPGTTAPTKVSGRASAPFTAIAGGAIAGEATP
ncbi:hypothetical protein M2323_001242 [Rhodoblastus acidophilus]|uniref:hypothetical protein n=1 Tax=Rhodoblastus acidophilus TaxID=1074 RepID=UPI0022251AF8|nr:hypothetical protein [Rhodoblastus acidophilus]MCW2283344.1 hypothetical protein [Rhodoblastus acidophilus]MCW2332332.1 hypothetical protein [Rhodoblastus acidophilus]